MNFNNLNYFPFVPLSKIFIEKYMLKANPTFVIIYIYSLKLSLENKPINIDTASKELDVLSSDIIKALKYWQNEKLLSLNQKDDNLFYVCFFDINCKDNTNNTNLSSNDTTENALYKEKQNVEHLFRLTEKKLAKTLTYQDKQILIKLYENYDISIEILAVLLTYCMEKGKTKFNYIEKVAIDWCENNIDTMEKAEAYIKLFDTDYKQIFSAFGLSGREPIKQEKDFIKKWIFEYKMPLDVIKEACARTVLKTGKANFEYANAILKKWQKENVNSIEDIKKLDSIFEANKKPKQEQVMNKPTYSKNKFVNYKQKKPDYEILRKLELKALKEGIENYEQ